MTSRAYSPKKNENKKTGLKETIVDKRNFVTMSFTGKKKDRTLMIKAFDVWERALEI